MALRILSDPTGLVSNDPFVIELDQIYAEFHQSLDIGQPLTQLVPLNLTHIHNFFDKIESSCNGIRYEEITGELSAALKTNIIGVRDAISHLKAHLKTFEETFNSIVEPYNTTRESIQHDLHIINDLLASVQYKDTQSALAHSDHDSY